VIGTPSFLLGAFAGVSTQRIALPELPGSLRHEHDQYVREASRHPPVERQNSARRLPFPLALRTALEADRSAGEGALLESSWISIWI